jgi:hypothetical protein
VPTNLEEIWYLLEFITSNTAFRKTVHGFAASPVALQLPQAMSSPGYRLKGPPELMLEQLWGCLYLVWYPYHYQRLVRKPMPRKAVHFELHDQVRYFFQSDPPVTVKSELQLIGGAHENSARNSSSPILSLYIIQSPSTQWEVVCSSTVFKTPDKTTVKLERLWISVDEKSFLGSVAVANLAHKKSVTCRFTFDYWETVSEVRAHYARSLPATNNQDELDRFLFTLELPDIALVHPGIKKFQCCIRYIVNGQESWDNNNGLNYQVSFRRKEPSKDINSALEVLK